MAAIAKPKVWSLRELSKSELSFLAAKAAGFELQEEDSVYFISKNGSQKGYIPKRGLKIQAEFPEYFIQEDWDAVGGLIRELNIGFHPMSDGKVIAFRGMLTAPGNDHQEAATLLYVSINYGPTIKEEDFQVENTNKPLERKKLLVKRKTLLRRIVDGIKDC